jgi:hypothetical protein
MLRVLRLSFHKRLFRQRVFSVAGTQMFCDLLLCPANAAQFLRSVGVIPCPSERWKKRRIQRHVDGLIAAGASRISLIGGLAKPLKPWLPIPTAWPSHRTSE